eukprot:tig00021319_g20259.t1
MFEAHLSQAAIFKKILDAIKELITDGSFDAASTGISLQAMDSSHVSLVSLLLKAEGFDHFRCDRGRSFGMNLKNLSSIIKCAGNDDKLTLKAEDDTDTICLVFENSETDKISEFEMKLMDIDVEHLGIPETQYAATVKMPASEFQRVCKDLSSFGDAVTMAVTKDGIKFSVSGDVGTGQVVLRQSSASDKKPEEQVSIDLQEPVTLSFALKYLNNFTKATSLSSSVYIKLSPDVPVCIEYKIENLGHIQYFLAPKIEENEAA